MAHAASDLGFDGNFATWMPEHPSSDASTNPILTIRQLCVKKTVVKRDTPLRLARETRSAGSAHVPGECQNGFVTSGI